MANQLTRVRLEADGIADAQVCRPVHSNTADAGTAGFGFAATCQEVVLKDGQAT